MIKIQVLGFECSACHKAYRLIEQISKEMDITIELTKLSDPQVFIQHNVLSVPAIIVNRKLMFQGGCPDKKMIVGWFNPDLTST